MIKDRRNLILGIAIAIFVIAGALFFFFYKEPQKIERVILNTPSKKLERVELSSESFPVYSYDAQQLRDPFASLIVKREERKKGVSPLESYDMEELKLTGVAWDKKGGMALIQAPDGRFYIIRENDRIGFSGGRVTKILKDAVEIKENNKKTTYMKLRAEEGE